MDHLSSYGKIKMVGSRLPIQNDKNIYRLFMLLQTKQIQSCGFTMAISRWGFQDGGNFVARSLMNSVFLKKQNESIQKHHSISNALTFEF